MMKQYFRSCVHSHTNLCDGKNTPEEMVLAALEHDFVSFGFSGHGHSEFDRFSMSEENELLYRQEVRRLRQVYGDRIEILLGVEHEAITPYPDFPYEYMLESLHYINYGGEKLAIDWSKERTLDNVAHHFGGDHYAYCRAYFDACIAAYEHSPAQICGHLDSVTKFNEGFCLFDETDPRYLSAAKDAMAAAVERGMVLELNTGAISRGYRTAPYPSMDLLKHLKDLKGEIIVTSDCHNKDHLACWYDQAPALLKACGFDHTLVLRKQGFVEEGL